MSSDLAVIVPTRGRPDNIRKVISAWDFTNAWDVADLVLAVDADDPEFQGYLDAQDETRNPDTGQPLLRIIVFPEWLPMVHKLNAVAATLADEGQHFALGFAGDDHIPQTIGWAKAYLAELKTLGTGMVYGDDGYQGKNLSTEWAVTTNAVVALGGRMIPADVEHMYCDNAIMDLFDGAGAMVYLPAVRIEHMHPIAGKAETDAQYRRVNSRDQFRKDRVAYESWKSGQMSIDLAAIKGLRPKRPVRPTQQQRSKPTMSRSPFPRFFKQVKAVTPDDVAVTLADLAIGVPADQEIVELGVYHAKTTLILAWGAQQGSGAHVTGIDPWDLDGNVYGEEMGDLASAHAWARHWVQSLGYSNKISLIQAFSYEVAPAWINPDVGGRKKVGLIFIDGDHTAEGARRDVLTWAPNLAPGATIAIDDYVNPNYPGVAQAIDALVADGTLEPVTVFHDRLGVTRLAQTGADPVCNDPGHDHSTSSCQGPAIGWDDPASDPLADTTRATEQIKTITGEGVSPSPYPAASGQVAVPEEPPVLTEYQAHHPSREELEAEWGDADSARNWLRESVANLDDEASKRETVQPGESENDNWAGASIDSLNLAQLKALARTRGIKLGARKDLRASIIQALREGE